MDRKHCEDIVIMLDKRIRSLSLSFEEKSALVCLVGDHTLMDMFDAIYDYIGSEEIEAFEDAMQTATEYLDEIAEKRISEDIDNNL
jgi:UTP:GlnB (protein PII) uridylyltransferase